MLKVKYPPQDLVSKVQHFGLTIHNEDESRLKEVHINPCDSRGVEDSRRILEELVETVVTLRREYKDHGIRPEIDERERVIVEFGSPNIAKPLHMGHLRSAVTGHFVARICKAAGHNVTSMCFLGDWGTQFGLLQV